LAIRLRIAFDRADEVGNQLRRLGCPPAIVDKHITALRRPRSAPRHYHYSDNPDRWQRQLDARPILVPRELGNDAVFSRRLRRRKTREGSIPRYKPADPD